jgi:hypothetical protein
MSDLKKEEKKRYVLLSARKKNDHFPKLDKSQDLGATLSTLPMKLLETFKDLLMYFVGPQVPPSKHASTLFGFIYECFSCDATTVQPVQH